MENARAFKMIEGRFSDQIKVFNSFDVSEDDSDTHFWAVKGRIKLAESALSMAPRLTVTTLARSLGDVYRAVKDNLSPAELFEWNRLNGIIEELNDKYEI